MIEHSHPVFLKAKFYDALNGYLETMNPTASNMTWSADRRTGKEWLEIATQIASQYVSQGDELIMELQEITKLMDIERFHTARERIRAGEQEARSEIRLLSPDH
jgi:hypothetical protein